MATEVEDLIAEARRRVGLPDVPARRELRVRSGLSQREVALACGVDRVSVARWETGKRTPRGEARARYCELLTQLAETNAA